MVPIKGTGYTLAKYTGTEHSPTTHKGLRDRLERHLCNRLGRHVHTRAVKSSVGVGQVANNCNCSCCAQRASTMPKAAWLRAADGMYRSTSLSPLLGTQRGPIRKGPLSPKSAAVATLAAPSELTCWRPGMESLVMASKGARGSRPRSACPGQRLRQHHSAFIKHKHSWCTGT